jgi:hypothetical protein
MNLAKNRHGLRRERNDVRFSHLHSLTGNGPFGLKNSWSASVRRTSRTSIGNIVHASSTTVKRSRGNTRDRTRPRLRWPQRARPDLLGHKSGDVTTDYSAAELMSLINAANRIVRSKDSPTLTVLRLVA